MAIWYVSTSGNDGNAGTSAGAAFATIAHAVNSGGTGNTSLAAGDEIRVLNDGTHSVASTIDIDTTAGSTTAPITLAGYNAAGTARETATISKSATTEALIDLSVEYWAFRDLDIDGNDIANPLVHFREGGHQFVNCILHDATAYGTTTQTGGPSEDIAFINCEVYGFSRAIVPSACNSVFRIFYCSIHGNTQAGIWCDTYLGAICIGNIIYNSGWFGIRLTSRSVDSVVIGNTIYDCDDGIQCEAERCNIINNSFSNCANYGLDVQSNGLWETDYNHFYSNTSGETSLAATPGENNASGDPLFTGSDDFTPLSGSPLLEAGLDAGTN